MPNTVQVKQPVKKLFMDGRAMWTLLLWLLTFSALLLTYFLVHWIPLVLVDAGVAQQNAIKGVALLNLGGIIGSLVISRISDRRGPYLAMSCCHGSGNNFHRRNRHQHSGRNRSCIDSHFSGRAHLCRGAIEYQRNRRDQLPG